MKRRSLVQGALASAAAAAGLPAAAQPAVAAPPAAPGQKVLRVSFPSPETGFDPAQTNDLYSRTVTAHIFEAPYRYDHLARPHRIRPHTAVAMPEVSADFRIWTFDIQPGILFQDHPALGGRPRELTAEDYVYSWKRFVDPFYKSPAATELQELGILGLNELRKAAIDGKQPFDYDAPVEGLRAIGRHRLQITLKEPRPRLIELLANSSQMGALAREVVERHRDDIMAHPVGTGPFRLLAWRRSSRIVLERHPNYRARVYDEQPTPGDTWAEGVAARLKGRRVPMVDRVEIAVIEESQPNWLAFLSGDLDWISLPGEFVSQATPGGRLAPNLAKRGVRLARTLNSDSVFFYIDMRDPVFGGMAPERVALRRAISLGLNVPRIIDRMYRGQGIVAQSPITPNNSGYDPAFRSEMGDYDLPRAKALLDLFGYVDRDGDGIRETPDGQPLRLEYATQPDQFSRGFDEMLAKDMQALGIRIELKTAQWAEQLKAARAGKLQMWMLGGSSTVPDGAGSLARYETRQAGLQNFARFSHPDADRLYTQLQSLPDGPEREAVFLAFKKLAVAYMPYKMLLHRIASDLTYPWLIGHRRPLFWRDWYQYVDLEPRSA
ncbi:MAG: bicyclomycin resistance protein [Rubrivivax sp.]|nr:bicyclomycin resistance protein [Rubrivivax sp.]